MTEAQVNQMIAAYFTAHRADLKGEQGSAGKNGSAGDKGAQGDMGEKGDQGVRGEKGETGPQGPGAISLNTSLTEIGTHPLATVGPWTVTLTCLASPSTNSTLTIKGPGDLTQSVATGGSPALSSAAIGSGKSLTVNNGQHLAETGFLTSGTTTYQLNIQMSAEEPGIENCPVVGAILVPAAS